MNDQEPLSDDLADLFASERRGPGAPLGARDRIAARLAASVALAPTVPSPHPRLASRAFHAVHVAAVGAAFVVGAAAGVAAVYLLHPPEAPRVVMSLTPITIGAPTDARSPVAPWSPVAAPSSTSPGPTSSVPVAPVRSDASARAGAAAASATGTIALEQAVLDTARVALGRDDGAAALTATDAHARRFPRGQLSEEREAIAIQALILLHRDPEARARASTFVRTYPNSALLPAIQEALGSGAAP